MSLYEAMDYAVMRIPGIGDDLRCDLQRKPWLTADERLAEAAMYAHAPEEITEDDLDDANEEGRETGRREAYEELLEILDDFESFEELRKHLEGEL